MEFTTIAMPSSHLELLDDVLTSHLVMYRAFVHEAVISEISDFLVKARTLRRVESIASTWKQIEETILCEIEAVLLTDFDVSEKTELATLYLDRQLATLEEDEEAPVDVIVANIVKFFCRESWPSPSRVAIHYSVLPTLPHQLITGIILSPTRSDSTREVVAVRKAIIQLIQCAADTSDILLLAQTVYQAVLACVSSDEVESAPKATTSGTLLICESVLREILRLLICEKSESRCVELFHRVVQPVAILVAPAAVASDSLGFFASEALLSYSPLVQAVPENLKSRMSTKGLDSEYLGDGCRECDKVLMRITFGPTGKRSEATAEIDSWLEGRGAWLLLFDFLSPEEQNEILSANEELRTSFYHTLSPSLPHHFHEWDEEEIRRHLDASLANTSPPPTASANIVSSIPSQTSLAATSGSTAAAPAPSTPAPPPPLAAALFSPRAAILDQVVGSFPRPFTPQFQPLALPLSPSTARPVPIVPAKSPVPTPLDALATDVDTQRDLPLPVPPLSPPPGRASSKRTPRLELSEIRKVQSDLGKHAREETPVEWDSEPAVAGVDVPSAKRSKHFVSTQPVGGSEVWSPLRGLSANASVADLLFGNGLPLPRPSREFSFVTGSSATTTNNNTRVDNDNEKEDRKITKTTAQLPPTRPSSQIGQLNPLNKSLKAIRSQTENEGATATMSTPQATTPTFKVADPPSALGSDQQENQNDKPATVHLPGYEQAPAGNEGAPTIALIPGQNRRGRGTNHIVERGRARGIERARGRGAARGDSYIIDIMYRAGEAERLNSSIAPPPPSSSLNASQFSMSFNQMPTEIYNAILYYYEDDELPLPISADKRLKRTLPLCQILWTQIHLQWPDAAVQHYLDRSLHVRRLGLSVFLDTRASKSAERMGEQARWAQFLREEMEHTVRLEIKMAAAHGSDALANALNDTPAPRLISWSLILDETAQNNNKIRTPFRYNAPLLRHSRIYASRPYELSAFSSLSDLALRIGHHNFKRLLELLRGASPSLKVLRLKGVQAWVMQRLPNDPMEPANLLNCTSLSLKNIQAHRVQYIVSNITCPPLSSLTIHEKMVQLIDDGSLLSNISSTLPRINPPAKEEDWLFLAFHPNKLAVEIQGYQFHTDWAELDCNDAGLLFQAIVDAASAPATTLLHRPSRLVVYNSIASHRTLDSHPIDVTLADLDILLHHVLQAYPSVKILKIMGNAPPVVQILRLVDETFLPNLLSVQTDVDIEAQLRQSQAGYLRIRDAQVAIHVDEFKSMDKSTNATTDVQLEDSATTHNWPLAVKNKRAEKEELLPASWRGAPGAGWKTNDQGRDKAVMKHIYTRLLAVDELIALFRGTRAYGMTLRPSLGERDERTGQGRGARTAGLYSENLVLDLRTKIPGVKRLE
ncbi:hypothetical protein SISNIDRAFT_470491 [Sistotremastrum niveocremeum HHB9708]|uniref:Uncharacterized protein n=1 Tax=Sistotremastrum niveocremeum HHB9708 TaxID=1314777 RepID=A0A164NTD2_9AGAM|nr:hypothetical protein SISNIDRAFT_470491 [Sistotremastrum niveocremeum HHB9708]